MPVVDGIRRCEELLRDVNGDRRLEADASAHLGVFEAMRGNFHEARRLVDRHMEILRDLGLKYEEFLANSIMRWDIEMLAGEAAAAERAVRAPYDATFVSGESRGRMAFAVRIALAICAQGRYAEALRYAEADTERGGPFVREQILWLRASARASAGLGELERGLNVSREAAMLAENTDAINLHGDDTDGSRRGSLDGR